MNKKQKYILFSVIKLLVISLAFWYIYKEIFQNKNFSEIKNSLSGIFSSAENIFYFAVTLLLIFFNWGTEALKWKFLVGKIEKIRFLKALFATLAGVTVSVFTPNRVGEYFGRILFLKSDDKIQAALITILGSLSQLLITIICGSVSLLFFLWFYQKNFLNDSVFFILVILVVLLNFFSVLLFFSTPTLILLLNKFPFLNRFKKYSDVFSFYSPGELFSVLCLSFFRYAVFSLQFFLLLKVFGVEIVFSQAAVLIPLIFFAVTVIPTITPAEIGVREFFALQFIGIVSENSLGIISAAFALWLVNLAFPAVAGAVCVLAKK